MLWLSRTICSLYSFQIEFLQPDWDFYMSCNLRIWPGRLSVLSVAFAGDQHQDNNPAGYRSSHMLQCVTADYLPTHCKDFHIEKLQEL